MYPSDTDYYLMDQPTRKRMTVGTVLKGVRRRAKLVVLLLVIGLVGGFSLAWSATPIYQAAATVQIERDTQRILDFEDLFQADATNDSFYQTQYQLIQSRTLARRVIEEQELLEHPEFRALFGSPQPASSRRRGPVGRILSRIGGLVGWTDAEEDPAAEQQAPELSEGQMEAHYRVATSVFLSRLTVTPIRNTRLAMISWTAADPRLAASTTNAIADTYVEMNLESRYETTARANDLLKSSIEEMRAEIDSLMDELEQKREELDGGSGVGTTVSDGPSLDSLRSRLTQAEFERMEKESHYQQLQSVDDPSRLAEVSENAAVRQRRQEYEELRARYDEMTRRFTEEHPDVQHLLTQMEEHEALLRQEERRVYDEVVSRARRDYEVVRDREQRLRGLLAGALDDARRQNQELQEVENLQMEIDNNRRLLDRMIARQGETDVTARLQAMRAPNVRVAERAAVPSAPSYPDTRMFVLLAGLCGLVLGVGAALVQDRLDNTAYTPDEIEMHLGLPNLATVPSLKDLGRRKLLGGGTNYAVYSAAYGDYRGVDADYEREVSSAEPELITMKYPKSGFSEAYRALRTRVLRSAANGKPHSILVTSSKPKEGKTTSAVNLATALARVGKKVLLVDADLRRPRLHRVFHCDPRRGLAHLLEQGTPLEELMQSTDEEGLWVLPAGPSPPNPSELLTSDRSADLLDEARKLFDVVIIDTSPILATVDALVLASLVDGVLVVVKGGSTPLPMVDRACRQLEEVGGQIVGVLLNEGDTDIRSEPPRYRRERPSGPAGTALVRFDDSPHADRPRL